MKTVLVMDALNQQFWLEPDHVTKFVLGSLILADKNGLIKLTAGQFATKLRLVPSRFHELLTESSEYIRPLEGGGFQVIIPDPKLNYYAQKQREYRAKSAHSINPPEIVKGA